MLLKICLILLAPYVSCIVIFATLKHNGRGLVLVSAPVLFVARVLLLPLCLLLFVKSSTTRVMGPNPFLRSFFNLVIVPLKLTVILRVCTGGSLIKGGVVSGST